MPARVPVAFSGSPSVMDLLQLSTFCSCNNLHDRSATFCISVLQKTLNGFLHRFRLAGFLIGNADGFADMDVLRSVIVSDFEKHANLLICTYVLLNSIHHFVEDVNRKTQKKRGKMLIFLTFLTVYLFQLIIWLLYFSSNSGENCC